MDYNIHQDSEVHLVLRLRGGMYHYTSSREDFVKLIMENGGSIDSINVPIRYGSGAEDLFVLAVPPLETTARLSSRIKAEIEHELCQEGDSLFKLENERIVELQNELDALKRKQEKRGKAHAQGSSGAPTNSQGHMPLERGGHGV